ncbi:hypothetical protein MJK70_00200 [Klebsiella pneumoniae]|nr:hypothetical protein MJK70_00200 [Klebsiella pneumoniae]
MRSAFLVVANCTCLFWIENMCREGFELAVSRPKVIFREIDGRKQELYENVTLDVLKNSIRVL